MKQSDIPTAPTIHRYGIANIFNVYSIPGAAESIAYSINRTVNFTNLPDIQTDTDCSYYFIYDAKLGDTWHLLSYLNYGTIELWWINAKLNGVKDATADINAGSKLRIIRPEAVDNIITSIFRVGE